MGVITYNGVASSSLGIVVEEPPEYIYPERDYELTHVPGRNGDIYIDKGSYKNVERTYKLAVGSEDSIFAFSANKIVQWLHSANGYARLEDTYEPRYYRKALYIEGGNIENILNVAGRITVSFNCYPQRYLTEGERIISISGRTIITNPTNFAASPIVTVRGSGTGVLRIGDSTITIESITSGMVIDSEIKDVYFGTQNFNDQIILSSNMFPTIKPGDCEVSFTGGITSVEIKPNWWTL